MSEESTKKKSDDVADPNATKEPAGRVLVVDPSRVQVVEEEVLDEEALENVTGGFTGFPPVFVPPQGH